MTSPFSPYFSGENVRLVALEKEDLPLTAHWINDERIAFFNGARFPVSLTEQAAWLEATERDRAKKRLVIVNRDDQKVGLVSLLGIDRGNQHADVGVYVAPEYQRRGYAREALTLLLRFAFHELNMYKLSADILAYNTSSVRLFESLGFRPDGVRRHHKFANGAFVDLLHYALFRQDFA